jgi:hypothetical protein
VGAFQGAQQNSGLAIAPARMDKLQDFAGGQHGFAFEVGADGGAQRLARRRVRMVIWKWSRLGPVFFQVAQDRVFREAAGGGVARENFRLQPDPRHGGKFPPTILPGLGDGGPDGKPGIRARRPFALHAKGEGHSLAAGGQGGQKAQFLRSQFAKAVQPESGDGDCGLRIADCGLRRRRNATCGVGAVRRLADWGLIGRRIGRGRLQGAGRQVGQAIGVLEIMPVEPVQPGALEEGQIAQFAAQRLSEFGAGGQFCQ